MKHVSILFSTVAAAAVFVSCESNEAENEPAPTAFTEPTRYGEFDRAPRVLIGRPIGEVVDYLENFKRIADTGDEETASIAPRTIRIKDRDRTITVDFAAGVCREVEIVGRHGDSILPRIPENFEAVRDAYAGKLEWVVEKNQLNVRTVEFDDGTAEEIPVSGDRSWESLDRAIVVEVSWRFDNPGHPTDGDYRMVFKQG
ncbi:MAG: hypothetical protein AAF585_00115 [Verrucomicrobiota bacterium]